MEPTERPALSSAAAVLLIGAPLLMVVGRLLLVPYDDQGWEDVLSQAAAHQARSDAGWLLAMAASGLLAAAALSMAKLLRGVGRAKAAAFVTVTTALGWAGSAGICTGGLLFSYQGKAADRAAQVQLLTDFNSGDSGYVFGMCVLAAVGYVVLGVGLARSGLLGVGLAGKGIAGLVVLGGLGTLLTMAGPLKPLLVLAALLLLAGQALAIRAVGIQTTAPTANWEPVRG
jgi:hypothetical protein